MDIATAVNKRDDQGSILESLVYSAVIHEESSRDALHGLHSSHKERFLAIVALKDNTAKLSKGRKDSNGIHQVGRSWGINELAGLESVDETGVIAFMSKEYYWRFNTALDKRRFCNALNTCYFKVCNSDIPRRVGWDHAVWKGVWDKKVTGNRQPPPQQIRVPKQRGSPIMDNWSNDMGHDSRYGPGRVSHADLSRRPSRGPNSPASPVIPNSEIPPIPEVAQKQRYRPQQPQQVPSPQQQQPQQQQQPRQTLRSSTSQASLRARQQQQSAYPQPSSQQPKSSGAQSGKSATPYPTSPLVDSFQNSQSSLKALDQQREQKGFTPHANASHRGSRGAAEKKASANTSHHSLPQQSRRESEDLERSRRGSQGVDSPQARSRMGSVPTMPLNLSKQTSMPAPVQHPSGHHEPAPSQQQQQQRQIQSGEYPPLNQSMAGAGSSASRNSASDPSASRPLRSSGSGTTSSKGFSADTAVADASVSRTPGHSQSPSHDASSLYTSAPNMPPSTGIPHRSGSPEHSEPPVLPSQSPARSQRSHRKQQHSDASDSSFMSARDDTAIQETASQHVRDGSMHKSISLSQPFKEAPIEASASQSRHSTQSFDELPTVKENQTPMRDSGVLSPRATPQLKKIHRLSPAKFGLSSPRRSKQFSNGSQTHARNPSNVSVSSIRSHTGDDEAYNDLKSVLTQLQFTGDEKFEDLEKKISGRIAQASDTQVAAVAALDDKLDQLDELLAESIDECMSLTDTLGTVAVNLATIGPQISSIENKSEGSQVLEMNKRMLVSEIERLLEGIQFPKEAEVFLVRTEFSSDDLSQLDSNLLKLYGPYQILHSTANSVVVAQNLVDRISSTAETFNLNFVAFMKQTLRHILNSDTGSGLGRLDVEVLRQLYPYTSVVLFTKETNQAAYKKLVTFYEDEAKNHFNETLPLFTITWRRKLESIIGNSTKFSFKPQGKPKASDESSGGTPSLKRGMSVKVGSHSMGLKSDSNKYQHKALPTKALDTNALATINSCFDELIDTYSEQVAAQQQVMVNLFHLSSSAGRKFDIYIHQVPLKVRKEAASRFGGPPQILEADSSRKVAQSLHKLISKIFASADEQVRLIPDLLSNTCILQAVYLIGRLEIKLEQLATTNQDYTKQLWLRLREMLVPHWRKFTETQSRLILDTHVNISKRVGIMPVAELFVAYVNSVEASMKALGDGAPKTRKLVNDSHGQIFRSINQVFSRSGQPINNQSSVSLSNPSEDKEALNFHVTMIENLYVIIQGLMQGENPDVIDSVLTEARTRYRKELEAYIADVEQRPLGRILEFLPKSNGQTPKFKQSTFKKVITGFDSKEMRKNVDALRKRVQKHFGDESADSALVGKVWAAISAEFESKFAKILALAKQNEMENLVPMTRQEVRDTMQSFA